MTKARANATAEAAKGDIRVGSGTNATTILPVGTDGQTLVANSSAATGMSWAGQFQAGKNRIINGDFGVNQRSFSSSTANGYMFDRFSAYVSDGTVTNSAQTFTLGTAPVTGYEGKNYLRNITTGQTSTTAASNFSQSIESVRTFAGQTVTVSFWAMAAAGTPKVAVEFQQQFGSGGSSSSSVGTYAGQVTLSTSWARYSISVAIPSIAGKTLGTSDDGALQLVFWTSAGTSFNSRTGSLGIQSGTFSFWGIQVEAGSVATAFQTATGTIQGELAACQRYYYRAIAASFNINFGMGQCYSTTQAYATIPFPVPMRTQPTALEQNGTASDYRLITSNFGAVNLTSVPAFNAASVWQGTVTGAAASGLVAGNATAIASTNGGAYLGWSAEL